MMSNEYIPVIELKNLSIGFQSRKMNTFLLNDLNLKAFEGQLIAMIGPNGSGKSTLIRTICQLHQPLSGEILFNSIPIHALNRVQLAKKVSLVSTELVRSGRLKVKDLVALGRFPYSNWYGQLNQQDHQRVFESLEQVAMLGFAERFTVELSDGEYQRVMIARALAQDTPVIILDEPTAFLDLPNKYLLVNLLWKLSHQQKKTILFSTHDLAIAMQFADLFWLIQHGGIQTGSPEDMILNRQIEELFSGHSLSFESESTQFKLKKELNKSACIKGEGIPAKLTQMALERMGFSTDCNKPALFTVRVFEVNAKLTWEIQWNKIRKEVYSVSELQQIINKHIN